MATIQIRRGALAGLPSGAAGEPLFTTDQFRLYIGSSGGNRLLGLLHNINATGAPTVNDDAGDGYSVGSLWTDTTNDNSYICQDSTIGSAVWAQIDGSGSSVTSLNSETGDVILQSSDASVTITPDMAGNINLSVAVGNLDHGQLVGLADDDHTQYLLADGSRALTTDWAAGVFNISAQTFESLAITGTPPFTVASTTVVVSLNADLLDGLHAASFALLTHVHSAADITSGTLDIARIADGSVTYAKIQDISAQARILGRASAAGAGDVTELTITQALDMAGSAHGSVLYRATSSWVTLPAGTSGQFLQTQGAGANPVWAAAGMDITGLVADDIEMLDEFPFYDVSGSHNNKTTTGRLAGFVNPATCDFRLTTESGVAYSTADRISQGTIYLTARQDSGFTDSGSGGRIALFDGTRWILYNNAQISLALSVSSGTLYDVFVYDNGGTLTLELTAWSSATVRATALELKDGVLVKTGATTRRYMGTIRGSGVNVTEDSATKRFVWSYYHRTPRLLQKVEVADSWTYATATWRSANNSTANRVEFVIGVNESPVEARVDAAQNGSATQIGTVGIGLDSTSANSAQVYIEGNSYFSTSAAYQGYPGIGYHFLQWLEYARTGTVTFFGDAGIVTLQSGIHGSIMG